MCQPAGIDQIFTGERAGGMNVFPGLPNSNHAEGESYQP